MSDSHKFTILGETGSGKTCYLLGMYYEMSMGVAGFTVKAKNDDDDKNLAIRYEILKDKSRGAGRFPAGTDDVQKMEFDLRFANETIDSFEWVDYPGGFLDSTKRDSDSELYKEVEESINNSYMLFICVDGANLVGDDTDEKIDKVRRKCGRNITPYLGDIKKHNENFPPVGIIITKYDLCKDDTDEDEIREIMEEAFDSLFSDEDALVFVIPVSLGDNLKDDDHRGDLKPINIELPILLGMNFAVVGILNYGKSLIEEKNQYVKWAREKKREEDNRWGITRWFFGGWDPDQLGQNISETEDEIQEIRQIAKFYKKKLNRINKRLAYLEMIFCEESWLDERRIENFWEEFQSIVDYF